MQNKHDWIYQIIGFWKLIKMDKFDRIVPIMVRWIIRYSDIPILPVQEINKLFVASKIMIIQLKSRGYLLRIERGYHDSLSIINII